MPHITQETKRLFRPQTPPQVNNGKALITNVYP